MPLNDLVIPAFHASMGMLLFAALLAFLAGWHGHKVPEYLSFAAMCLFGAGYQYYTADYYLAGSVAEAATALRGQGTFIYLFLMSFFIFIGLYARPPHARFWMAGAVMIYGVFLVANMSAPYSLRFDSLEMTVPLRLPWGEHIPHFSGARGLWHPLIAIITVGGLSWGCWAVLSLWRRGGRRQALYLGIAMGMLLASAIVGVLIDYGVIAFVYVAGFGFLAMVVVMGASLVVDLRERNLALTRATEELREEVAMRRSAEAKVRRTAYEDYVTTLPNRAAVHEHLTETIAQAAGAGCAGSLCIIDLDHFKNVNDALGHDVGDEVLRQAARRLQQICGDGGFLGRLGGDEFALVLPPADADRAQAESRAQSLSESCAACFSEPFRVGDQVLNQGASIGIACYPGDGDTVLDLLRHSEMALYRAKSSGRGSIHYYRADMQAQADSRLDLERGLRHALENGEFELHYQPQVDAKGRMTGAEALIRWRHPERGLVSPVEFIGVAEETGLIHPIGAWVLEHACSRLSAWLSSGTPFRGYLSVNVCAWEFARADYVTTVQQILANHDVDPHRLTLEITETALLYDIQDTAGKLARLRDLGISIALDDFGTGYSSLAYLKDLPLDTLKIDQGFIREMDPSRKHPLVETMVAIGRHMDLQVIAEGVETEAQRAALVQMGCVCFQGYLFSRPLAEEAFLAWVASPGAANGQETSS